MNTNDLSLCAALEELDRLRAEVASLKEDRDAWRNAHAEACRSLTDFASQIEDLTQQLAAANGLVEKYRGALQQVIVLDQPKYNYGNCADVARAALPQQVKSE